MKKVLILVAVVSFVAGCSRERELPALMKEGDIFQWEMLARESLSTKTTFDGSSLSWAKGDLIGLFVDGIQTNRPFANTAGNSFSGNLIYKDQTSEAVNYYSYYPWVHTANPSTIIDATLPIEQTAPFDGHANFMVADVVQSRYDENDMPNLTFHFNNQLMSIVKVTIVNTDESSQDQQLLNVELEASGGETLAGQFSFDITDPTSGPTFSTTASLVSNVVKSVYPELSRPSLGLADEHIIYLLVNPTTVDGLKLTIRTTDNIYILTSSTETTFEKGKVVVMPTVTLDNLNMHKRIRSVVLWGDSIFNGLGEPLQELLGSDWQVINGGVGGDVPLGIAGRQGGIPMCLDGGFTIPASYAKAVSISHLQSSRTEALSEGRTPIGFESWYTKNRSKLNPCVIKFHDDVKNEDVEIEGTIIISGDNYSFRRRTSGEAIDVPDGATVVSYGARAYRDADVMIMDMGGNGTITDYNILSQIFQYMVNYSTKQKYVIIGFHFPHMYFPDGKERIYWTTEYRDIMTAAFGNNFIDMWTLGTNRENAMRLLKESGAYPMDAVSFTDADDSALTDGYWPESFASTSNRSDLHLNSYGDKAMTIMIKERMQDLGYLDY